MSDDKRNMNESDADEQMTARLLQLGGTRDEISQDIEARVYARVQREWAAASKRPDDSNVYRNVQSAWRQGPRSSLARRWGLPMALAASAILAVALILQPSNQVGPGPVAVATVVRTVGVNPDSAMRAPGETVFAGDSVSTGPGEGISLRLRGGESVRLRDSTRLTIVSAQRLELVRGQLYADTGTSIYRDDRLTVDTPLGPVTDIGTQFAVAYADQVLDVAVREGRVDVAGGTDQVITVAGERTTLSPAAGAVTTELAPDDDYWSWATALAPVFDIENKPLYEFLRWVARETGRELVFQDDELRMASMRTDLHGSVEDVPPLEALAAVLQTTSYRYRIEANRLIIER